jgi:hypothetical protein
VPFCSGLWRLGRALGDIPAVLLHDLLTVVGPLRDRIRSSGNKAAHEVETLMDVSVRHVSVAALGADLFRRGRTDGYAQETIGADQETFDLAAMAMVFVSGATSIDLCASALMRWHGQTPKDNPQFDLDDLRAECDRETVQPTPTQSEWLRLVDGSRYPASRFVAFRHAVVHSYVQVDVTIRVGRGTNLVSSVPGKAQRRDTETFIPIAVDFVQQAWRQFWPALVDVP